VKENTKTPKANFQARSKLTVSDQRIHYAKVAPEAYDLLENVSAYADKSGLPRNLLELVKLKASLLNGCTYCIKYHSAQARSLGETEERIWLLSTWDRVPIYTDEEKAAFAWTEELTLIARNHVPDRVYEEARKYFSEKQLVDLTMAVIAINSWNRMSISMRDKLP
jgi:AhpD family alkylhydroperoxidase